jgi:hypothetical protein
MVAYIAAAEIEIRALDATPTPGVVSNSEAGACDALTQRVSSFSCAFPLVLLFARAMHVCACLSLRLSA